jgi:hypothetical protein
MSRRQFRSIPVLAGLILLSSLILPAGAAAAGPTYRVVADGLYSPRGLSFASDGSLYAAEAGDATHSGAILKIRHPLLRHPRVRTVIGGLASIGDQGEFLGIDGISVVGHGEDRTIYGIMGASPQATGNDAFGALIKVREGRVRTIANVGSFMYNWTADHSSLWKEFPDSNPYAVLAVGGHVYVADAGANTLIPTCIAKGPDGALYVGILALVDSAVLGPSAKVYRVDPKTVNLADPTATPMTEWATGLWPINGCAFGRNHTFYASQLFTNPAHDMNAIFADPQSDVVAIPWDSPSTHRFLTGGALAFTGGVAVSRSGVVFVTNHTAFVPDGQIVRLTSR